MSEERGMQPDIAMLRMKVAINHFKRLLLGDLHLPAVHQKSATFDELGRKCRDVDIAERTWKSWFANPPIVPRIGTIQTLDELASCAIRVTSRRGCEEKALPSEFFSQMVHGGLVSEMMKASKSKYPLIALRDRAESYTPISALHLHLDAIEVSALSRGYGKIPWHTVKRVGAERILSILTERWRPRQGAVFKELTSDLRLEWEAADDARKSEIRAVWDRFRPPLFLAQMNAHAKPEWRLTGIDHDVSPLHIYKLLFALAADSKFLRSDRLVAWALDLSTAALAMHALAWTDRYATFDSIPMADELIYWIALDEILFGSESLDADNTEIIRAMERLDARWTDEAFGTFSKARETYHSQLVELGISPGEVREAAMQATVIHPIECRA